MIEISAHRRDTDRPGELAAALASGADYVELDVRRTGDGELVVRHDPQVAGLRLAGSTYELLRRATGDRVPRVAAAMEQLAGRVKGHLDLKEPGVEHDAVDLAEELLGPGNYVVTCGNPAAVAAIKRRHPDTLTALSLGRTITHPRALQDLYPMARVRDSGADWVAVNHRFARFGVLRQCAEAGVPAMVWTVNEDPQIRRFLTDSRVAVLITDRPRHAVELRRRLSPSS